MQNSENGAKRAEIKKTMRNQPKMIRKRPTYIFSVTPLRPFDHFRHLIIWLDVFPDRPSHGNEATQNERAQTNHHC